MLVDIVVKITIVTFMKAVFFFETGTCLLITIKLQCIQYIIQYIIM